MSHSGTDSRLLFSFFLGLPPGDCIKCNGLQSRFGASLTKAEAKDDGIGFKVWFTRPKSSR